MDLASYLDKDVPVIDYKVKKKLQRQHSDGVHSAGEFDTKLDNKKGLFASMHKGGALSERGRQ